MPLSRSSRIDRRRRVMLDAVAADSEFAVESVRVKKRSRTRENLESTNDDDFTQKYRDPGYSQAVRRTCQQRMVQLIPVRRGTLSIVLSCMWMLWGGLLFSHYWIFTRAALNAAPNTTPTGFLTLPIAQLFHLRSPHSIAQWLTCQLWMLTAVAAWMIFQLRRHKLDDYRARYRIWVVLAIAAAFSSFEASSSGLLLLGISIDGWAKREIGYAGWPLVLATFASIIGVIGIRLCSELKSAPMSVVSWLFGLMAWALAALLGTGLLKISWSPATIDLVVGGSLLGGILAVFQASGIYLRQTYIHAQKRFLVRNGANLAPIQWKVPKLSLRRKRKVDELGELDEQNALQATSGKSKWKMPWSRKRNDSSEGFVENIGSANSVKRESTVRSVKPRDVVDRNSGPISAGSDSYDSVDKRVDKSVDRGIEKTRKTLDDNSVPSKPKGRLFGIIPHRTERNEKLDAEPIREDDGPMEDQGLTKKRGWFGIGGNRDAEVKSSETTPRSVTAPRSVLKPDKHESKQTDDDKNDATSKSDKRSFWSRKSNEKSASTPQLKHVVANEAPKSKRGWISKFSKTQQLIDAAAAEGSSAKQSVSQTKPAIAKVAKEQESLGVDGKDKKSWLSFASRKAKEPAEQKVVAQKKEKTSVDEPASKTGRRGLFGMLDGLKLKPPTEDSTKKEAQPSTRPVPIKQGQQIPSTQPDSDDEDGDDDYSGRPMSKADRKKLRRQGQDDRRAA